MTNFQCGHYGPSMRSSVPPDESKYNVLQNQITDAQQMQGLLSSEVFAHLQSKHFESILEANLNID